MDLQKISTRAISAKSLEKCPFLEMAEDEESSENYAAKVACRRRRSTLLVRSLGFSGAALAKGEDKNDAHKIEVRSGVRTTPSPLPQSRRKSPILTKKSGGRERQNEHNVRL